MNSIVKQMIGAVNRAGIGVDAGGWSTKRIALIGCLAAAAACSSTRPAPFCDVQGPTGHAPTTIHRIERGMSQAEIERILGKPDYSPISGQYYHGTGGYCEMAPGRRVPCGYVLDYRGENFDHEAGISALDGLQDCWWGGIGE